MVSSFIRKIKNSRQFKATKFLDKIKLPLMFLRFEITGNNFELEMIVKVNDTYYRAVDYESLIIISPNYEQYIQRVLKPDKNDVFVDVGSHIGNYTLRIAKKVGSEGKVIAIEANPNNFRALVEGIKLNNLENVTALNVAAYDEKCEMPMYFTPKGKGRGSIIYSDRQEKTNYNIQAKPLDIILEDLEIPQIDYIKVDVEGAEYEALKGAKKTIERYLPKIITNTTLHEREILEFMKKLNYIPIKLDPTNYLFKPISEAQNKTRNTF